MRYGVVPFVCLWVSGCNSTPPPPAPVPIKQVCIPVTPWSAEQQAKLATALQPLPRDSVVFAVVEDWIGMRRAAMACATANR